MVWSITAGGITIYNCTCSSHDVRKVKRARLIFCDCESHVSTVNILDTAISSESQFEPDICCIGCHDIGNSIDKDGSNVLGVRNVAEHAVIKLGNFIQHFTMYSMVLSKSKRANWECVSLFFLQAIHRFNFAFSWRSIRNTIGKEEYRCISTDISALFYQFTCSSECFICICCTIGSK